ncbi:MAG: xanthine dehydrogenase family protein subunit M [Pseudomonadota bacterium]
MRISHFEYHAATSLKDALDKLRQFGPDARVIAGGTDLVIRMKLKIDRPKHVIGITNIKELDYVRKEGSTIRIGALSKFSDLASESILRENIPILCEAASKIGSWQIRNMATIGGNLCSASPSADSAPALLVLNARLVIAGPEGEEEILCGSFFTGPRKNVLQQNQILKEILVDQPIGSSAGTYLKLMRKKAADLAVVGVAVQCELDQDGERLANLAIGLCGVASTPIRTPRAEAILKGLNYDQTLEKVSEAARTAAMETQPFCDRASADYRKAVVEVYVRRAVVKILDTLFSKEGGQQ